LEADYFANAGKMTGINFDKYDDIPIEVSDKEKKEVAPLTTFTAEVVTEELMRNILLAKFTKPTPVQRYSIPICNMKRDLMACAQTGSGKTAGFLFPCISMMLRAGPPNIPRDRSYRSPVYPTALILAPTRELALQIFKEAKKFCYRTGIQPCVVYGGARSSDQMRELSRGADMLVATPGRLEDFLSKRKISLSCTRFLVLDEADQMLDMGFEPQIRDIVERYDMADKYNRQTMMFSATFPHEIQRLAEDFLENHFFLAVGEVGSAASDVQQSVEYVKDHDKEEFLLHWLDNEFTSNPKSLILVFVETKRQCDKLEYILCESGVKAASIHGDRDQGERESALHAFRAGHRPVLVATSVASRGLDIPNVTWVLNYDMPTSLDVYVHRIGRTGRAGNIGNALSLVNEKSSNIARDLYERLREGKQDPPNWLKSLSSQRRGGGRRGTGGKRFGSKDYRSAGRGGGSGGGHWSRSGGGGGYGGSDNSAW